MTKTYIVEFMDHLGKVRETQPFRDKMSAELARIFIPFWCETKIIEKEVSNVVYDGKRT